MKKLPLELSDQLLELRHHLHRAMPVFWCISARCSIPRWMTAHWRRTPQWRRLPPAGPSSAVSASPSVCQGTRPPLLYSMVFPFSATICRSSFSFVCTYWSACQPFANVTQWLPLAPLRVPSKILKSLFLSYLSH